MTDDQRRRLEAHWRDHCVPEFARAARLRDVAAQMISDLHEEFERPGFRLGGMTERQLRCGAESTKAEAAQIEAVTQWRWVVFARCRLGDDVAVRRDPTEVGHRYGWEIDGVRFEPGGTDA